MKRMSCSGASTEFSSDGSYREADVLCGRGCHSNHIGNQAFLQNIESMKDQYILCETSEEKTKICCDILHFIYIRGGRFVRRDQVRGQHWYEISRVDALKKVKRALRKPSPSSLKKKSRGPVISDLSPCVSPRNHGTVVQIIPKSDVPFGKDIPSKRATLEAYVSKCDIATELSPPSSYTDMDVIGGQGGLTNFHPGNQFYLKQIEARVDRYKASGSVTEKTRIAEEVVEQVKLQGGRFMKKVGSFWCQLSVGEVLVKVKQALRKCNTCPLKKRKRAEADYFSGVNIVQTY